MHGGADAWDTKAFLCCSKLQTWQIITPKITLGGNSQSCHSEFVFIFIHIYSLPTHPLFLAEPGHAYRATIIFLILSGLD